MAGNVRRRAAELAGFLALLLFVEVTGWLLLDLSLVAKPLAATFAPLTGGR